MGDRLFKRPGVRAWYAWIQQPDGSKAKRSTGCIDAKAANLRADQLERESLDPAHAAASKATTRQLLDAYVASRVRLGRAEGTLHHVRTKAGHLLRLLPHLASGITHAVLEDYIDVRLEEEVRRTTIKKELRVLGAALKLARRNKLFATPVDEVMPELEDDVRAVERSLTPWELVWLVRAFIDMHDAEVAREEVRRAKRLEAGEAIPDDESQHQLRALRVVYIVATGARWSESERAVPSEDVDWRRGVVLIRGSKTRTSWGEIPITPLTAPLFRWTLARMRDGDRFAPWANVRRDLLLACANAGIPRVSPNDLRRTFSRWLRLAGVPTDQIAAAMRHTDSRMVERVYGRISGEELSKVLGKSMSPGPLMGAGPEKTDNESES